MTRSCWDQRVRLIATRNAAKLGPSKINQNFGFLARHRRWDSTASRFHSIYFVFWFRVLAKRQKFLCFCGLLLCLLIRSRHRCPCFNDLEPFAVLFRRHSFTSSFPQNSSFVKRQTFSTTKNWPNPICLDCEPWVIVAALCKSLTCVATGQRLIDLFWQSALLCLLRVFNFKRGFDYKTRFDTPWLFN